MKRYNGFLYKDERGITFKVNVEKGMVLEVTEGTNGKLMIRTVNEATTNANLSFSTVNEATTNANLSFPTVSAGEYAETLSVYTDDDGNQAVVPPGWTVSGVCEENTIWGRNVSLVIYHIPKEKVSGINWKNPSEVDTLMKTYNQFVWIPVELLTASSTLNGVNFNEKFGRMNYLNEKFSEKEYYEILDGELLLEKRSVNRYGGYYSSRYNISKDEETGKPRSVKGAYPWTCIEFLDAIDVARTMIESETITSHLMYGAEYDTQEKWVIESGATTLYEIVEDSTKLGNYYNNETYPRSVVKTGEDGCINNIYGFAGNVKEWTQEKNYSRKKYYVACRGGYYLQKGENVPVAFRKLECPIMNCSDIGFRVVLCIESVSIE